MLVVDGNFWYIALGTYSAVCNFSFLFSVSKKLIAFYFTRVPFSSFVQLGVPQFVRAPNGYCKVVSSLPTSGIARCCVFGKTLNAIIPTSEDAAQWIRAQFGNRQVVSSWFGF